MSKIKEKNVSILQTVKKIYLQVSDKIKTHIKHIKNKLKTKGKIRISVEPLIPIPNKAIIVSLLVGGLFFSGCMLYINRDKSMVKVCESRFDYNKGIGLTFYVGKDGRTIDKIEKNDTVSLDFIEANLTKDKESSKKILDEYKKNAEFFFNETVEKYKDISWLSANLEKKDNYIKAVYTFDVSHKDFNFDKYKNVLEEFSLQYYFNKEEKKFIYDETVLLSDKTPLGTIENVGCYDAPKEVKVVKEKQSETKKRTKDIKTKEENPK